MGEVGKEEMHMGISDRCVDGCLGRLARAWHVQKAVKRVAGHTAGGIEGG